MAREIKADTQELLDDTSAIKQATAQILAEIVRSKKKLSRDPDQCSTGFILERYLDNLTSYAETVCDPFSDDIDSQLSSNYKPDTISTSVLASGQGSTLDERVATLHIQDDALSDNIGASSRQNAVSFLRNSNTDSTSSSSTRVPAAARTFWASLTGRTDNLSSSTATTAKDKKFTLFQEIRGHRGGVNSVTFSPDGRRLASSGYHNMIQIWADRQGTFEQVQEVEVQSLGFFFVAFLPDGYRLASGGYDKKIRIWAESQGRL